MRTTSVACSAVAAILTLTAAGVDAWVLQGGTRTARRSAAGAGPTPPLPRLSTPARRTSSSSTRLHNTENLEEQLRDELAERNAGDVAREEKFAVADGSGLETLDDIQKANSYVPAVTDQQREALLERQIERMTRPRAYPLFVLEKVAEVVEGFVAQVTDKMEETGLSWWDSSDKAADAADDFLPETAMLSKSEESRWPVGCALRE